MKMNEMNKTTNKSVQKQQEEQQAKKVVLISGLNAFINGKQFNDKLVNAILDSVILSNEEINEVKKDLQKILDDSKKKETNKSKLASTFIQKLRVMEIVNNIPNEIQTIKNNNGFYSYEMAEYIKKTFDDKVFGKEVISKFCNKFKDQIEVLSRSKEKPMEISPMLEEHITETSSTLEKQKIETLPMTPKECRMFVHCMSAGLENVGLFPEHFLELGNESAEVTRNENESNFEFVKRSSLAIIDTNKLTMFALNLKDGYVGTFCKQQTLDQIMPMIQGQINDIFTQGENIKLSLEEKKEVCNKIAKDIINSFRNNVNVQGVAQSSDGLDIDLKDKQQILSEYVELSYEKAQKMELQKQLEALGKKLDETTKNYNENTILTSTQKEQIEKYKQQFSAIQNKLQTLLKPSKSSNPEIETPAGSVVIGNPDENERNKELNVSDLKVDGSKGSDINELDTTVDGVIGLIANLQEQLGKMQKQLQDKQNEFSKKITGEEELIKALEEQSKSAQSLEFEKNQITDQLNSTLDDLGRLQRKNESQRLKIEKAKQLIAERDIVIEKQNDQLQRKDQQITDQAQKLKTEQEGRVQAEAQLEEARQQIADKTNLLTTIQAQLAAAQQENENKTKQITEQAELLTIAQNVNQQLQAQLDDLTNQNNQLTGESNTLKQQLGDAQKKVSELEAKLQQKEQESRQKDEEIARIQNEDEKLRKQLQERDRKIARLEQEAEKIEGERQSIQGLYSSTENSKDKRIGQYIKDLKQLGDEYKRTSTILKSTVEKRTELEGQLKTIQGQLTTARDEKTTVDQERKQLVEQLQQKNTVIEKMQQQITGLQDQIKNLQENKIQQDLELAKSKTEAQRFEKLNKILQKQNDDNLRWASGIRKTNEQFKAENLSQRGQITELTKQNSQYERQIKELQQQLGTEQDKNKKQAETIAIQQKQLQDKVQELQKKEQALTEANIRLQAQQQEIERQQQQIEDQNKALTQAKEAQERLEQQIKTQKENIETLTGQLDASNAQIQKLTGDINRIDDEKSQLVTQGEDLKKQISNLESTIEQTKQDNEKDLASKQGEIDILKSDLASKQDNINNLKNESERLQTENSSKSRALEEQKRQLNELKGQLAINQQEQQTKDEESRRVLEEKTQLEQSKIQLEKQLKSAQNVMASQSSQIKNLNEKIKQQTITNEKLQSKNDTSKDEKIELERKIRSQKTQLAQYDVAIAKLKEEQVVALKEAEQREQQLQNQLQEQQRLAVAEEATNAAALEEQKQTYERQLQQERGAAARAEVEHQNKIEELNQTHQQQLEIQQTTINEKDAKIAELEILLRKALGQHQQQSEQLEAKEKQLKEVEAALQKAQQERDASAAALENEKKGQQQLQDKHQKEIEKLKTDAQKTEEAHQQELQRREQEVVEKAEAEKTAALEDQEKIYKQQLKRERAKNAAELGATEQTYQKKIEESDLLNKALYDKIDSLEKAFGSAETTAEMITDLYNQISQQLYETQQENEKLRKQANRVEKLKRKVEQLQQEKQQHQHQLTEKQGEIDGKDAEIAQLRKQVEQLQKEREQHQQLQEQVENEKAAKTIKLKVGNDEFSVELSDIKLDGEELSGEKLATSFKEIFEKDKPVEVANIFKQANEYVNGLEKEENQKGLEALYGVLNGLSGKNDSLKKAIQDDGKTLEAFKKLNDNLKTKDETRYNEFRIVALQQLTVVGEMQKAMELANILGVELVKAQAVDKEVQAEAIQNKEGAVQTEENVQTEAVGTQIENLTPSTSTVVDDENKVSKQSQIEMFSSNNNEGKPIEQQTPTASQANKTVVLNMNANAIVDAKKKSEQENSTAQELSAQKQLTQALNNASNSLTTSENNSVKKSETFVYYKCIQEKEGKKEDIGLKTELGNGDVEGITFPIELRIEGEKATLGEVVAYAKDVLESIGQEVNPNNIMKMLDLQGQGIGKDQLENAKKLIANEIKKFADNKENGLTEEKLREEADKNQDYQKVLKSVEAKASTLIKNNDKINRAAKGMKERVEERRATKPQGIQLGGH